LMIRDTLKEKEHQESKRIGPRKFCEELPGIYPAYSS
jgi:hypothetical protein